MTLDLPDDEQTFLRDLIKVSRQKPHLVEWTDRDGTARAITLSQPEVVKLNILAKRLSISKIELLQRATHIPKSKPSATAE